MSRRLALRLVPVRAVDDAVEELADGEAAQDLDEQLERESIGGEAEAAADGALPDQPPALGATAAAPPSR